MQLMVIHPGTEHPTSEFNRILMITSQLLFKSSYLDRNEQVICIKNQHTDSISSLCPFPSNFNRCCARVNIVNDRNGQIGESQEEKLVNLFGKFRSRSLLLNSLVNLVPFTQTDLQQL